MDTSFRILPDTEYDRLKGLWKNDEWIPNPKLSTVIVAEAEGRIVGFVVAQNAVHLEPLWVAPNGENSAILGSQLFTHMAILIMNSGAPGFFSTTTDPEIGDYLQRLGMKELPHKLYSVGLEE